MYEQCHAETTLICHRLLSPVCVCVCTCKCNVSECYSAVVVIRLTYMYTSTKTCIKNEWYDYGEYIDPLSYARVMHFSSAFHNIK